MLNETQTPEVQDVPFEVPDGYKVLTDAEMEQLTASLVESHQEKWEIQEIVDNAVAAGEMHEMLRNEFLYEFKQGGRDIRGLTAAMIAHLATARGISEVTEEREHIGDDPEADKHEFTIVVEGPDPLNPDRLLKRTGFSEEPKIAYGKYDRFAKQKAYTKAFRNACLKLLPQDLIIATIYKLAKLVPADWTPQQPALPPPQENGNGQADTPRDTARKAMYAQYNKRKDELAELDITEAMLRDGILDRFNVDSRADLTEKQYVEVREALTGEIADWVLDLAPKPRETKTEKEGDQQPF